MGQAQLAEGVATERRELHRGWRDSPKLAALIEDAISAVRDGVEIRREDDVSDVAGKMETGVS